MAVDDLMNEDDFFSENKKESEQEPENQRQDFPEDDLFTGMPAKEEEPAFEEDAIVEEEASEIIEESPDEIPQDFSEDVQDELELDEIPAQEEEAAGDEENAAQEYYEDKQEKISYRPFFIVTAIVAIVVILFIVLKFWVFTDEVNIPVAETDPATKAATENQNKPSAEEIKKTAFYKTLTAETQQSLSSVSNIASAVGNVNKVSSILLYGDECLIEVYSKNRSELAKLNMNFKQNVKGQNLEIISSSPRPGTSGGILGLFRLKKTSSTGAASGQDVDAPFQTSEEAARWLDFLVQNNSLLIKNSKTRKLAPADDFNIYEVEANINGGVGGCLRLIDDIASAGKNVKIHKLNLTAVDQRKFNPNKYQLRMILRIYI